MTTRNLVVVGAGGFGREVLDVIEAMNAALPAPRWDVLGVIDDAPAPENLERLTARSVQHLGSIENWVSGARGDADVVIGVGSPAARRRIAEILNRSGPISYPVLLHPRANIGSRVSLGPGTVICGGVQLSTNSRTGAHVHLNPNASIGHDTTIDSYVSVNPGAIVSGDCRIASGALVGAGSVILRGVTVGVGATVGASGCVVHDVSPWTVVKGVPAR